MSQNLHASQAQEASNAERVSFRKMYNREFDWVCFTLQRLGVRAADLNDVGQEVFVTVSRKWHESDPSQPIRPWLAAFMVRAAANYRRLARHRHDATDAWPELAATTLSPSQELERKRARSLVQQALAKLDDSRRTVFVLHELEDMSGPEIAQALGVPVNTIYDQLRVARLRFTQAVRELRDHDRE